MRPLRSSAPPRDRFWSHDAHTGILAVSERLLHVRCDGASAASIARDSTSRCVWRTSKRFNAAAFAGEADVTKLSFHAYAYCADDYVLLDAGSALGRNCGPLLISQPSDLAGGGRVRAAAHRDPRQVHDRQLSPEPRVSPGDRQDGVSVFGHRRRAARWKV